MDTALFQLYQAYRKKYFKYSRKLNKKLSDHSFWKLSKYRQYELLRGIQKCKYKLKQLESRLKLTLSGSALAFFLTTSSMYGQDNLGPFFNTQRSRNSLRPPIPRPGFDNLRPEFVDIDSDGDLDLFLGNNESEILFYENNGYGQFNPGSYSCGGSYFPFATYGKYSYPYTELSFADIDGDGDQDAFVFYGYTCGNNFYFWENISEEYAGSNYFINATDSADNPFRVLLDEEYSSPFDYFEARKRLDFANFDQDADLEAVLTSIGDPPILLNKNTSGQFERVPFDVFQNLDPNGYFNFSLADFDGDGDPDLIAGGSLDAPYDYDDQVFFFENPNDPAISSASDLNQPFVYNEVLNNQFNPLAGVDLNVGLGTYSYSNIYPILTDLDADGDLDLIVTDRVEYERQLRFFKYNVFTDPETGDTTSADFNEQFFLDNPFSGLDVGYVSKYENTPNFASADFDGDGDLDILTSGRNPYGEQQFEVLINSGGTFSKGTLNTYFPDLVYYALDGFSPSFVDVDQDGDLDLIGTGSSSGIQFFENVTTELSANFQFQTDNPFGFDPYSQLARLADIDGDNDLDLFLSGNSSYSIIFYRNTAVEDGGPATGFSFTYDSDNPLEVINDFSPYGSTTNFEFLDIDRDGDLDVVTGNEYAYQEVYLFRNEGTATNPGFVYEYSPFSVGYGNDYIYDKYGFKPILIDVDSDGDTDMYAMDQDGRVTFFSNDNLPPRINLSSNSITLLPETQPSTVLDDALTIFDQDFGQLPDSIVQVTVEILNFDPALDSLTIGNSGAPIDVTNTNGLLTLSAQPGLAATRADFENLLRTVQYTFLGDETDANSTKSAGALATTSLQRDIRLRAVDQDGTLLRFGGENFSELTLNVVFPNEPPEINGTGTPPTFNEGGAPVVVDNTITVSDADDTNLASATVSISGVESGDEISVTPQGGVTAMSLTGTSLTLNGPATPADFEATLRTVTFQSTGAVVGGTRTITFTVNDGEDVASYSIQVNVSTPAPELTTSNNPVTFTENDSPVVIDPTIAISDTDDTDLESATVTITGNFLSDQDTLIFSDQNGISGNYSSGVLTLTGTSSLANYEAALRSVQYENTSENPDESARTVTFQVNDGTFNSNNVAITVNVVAVNDPPTISDQNFNIPENSPSGTMVGTISASDVETPDVLSYSILSGNTGSTFSVNPSSGVLTVADETLLDFETNPQFILEVQVSDGTENATAMVTINLTDVDENLPPVVSAQNIETQSRSVVEINLEDIISDPDNLFSELNITATGTVNEATYTVENNILTIDYSMTSFVGTDVITLTVFDGIATTVATFNVNVVNAPPEVEPENESTQEGSTITINLRQVINDPDNAFEDLTITAEGTVDGATYTVQGDFLIIDYSGTNFSGTDTITLTVSDGIETRTATFEVEVEPFDTDIEIINAVAPNGNGQNDFFEIRNLPANSSVVIFNRWGDRVYEQANYDGDGNDLTRTFTGNRNVDGSDELISGTYFYKIIAGDGQEFRGFLLLRR